LKYFQPGIYEAVKEIVERNREGITAKKELLQAIEYYLKKYLNPIHRQLAGKP
jgi:hypothetical protein